MSQPGQPAVLEIAKVLRRHKELKQRKGLFQNNQTDFFRYKRFLRALTSKEYLTKTSNQPDTFPSVQDPETHEFDENKAKQIFIMLISNQIIVPVKKLHTNELKEHDLKPNKDFPHLIATDKAILQPNEYYIWNYNPKTIWDYLMVWGVILTILALVCYPLWPLSMRRGTYYISLAALWFIIAFFVIAIIRLCIAILSYPFTRGDKSVGLFWIFPNFFEDCGIVDSFKPLYGFGDLETYSYQKKMKRAKKRQQRREAAAKKNHRKEEDEDVEKIEEVKESVASGASTKPILEDVDDEHM
ncbi:translocation protein Sec62p [Monosporozyma unispora]|nr:Translocation protein S62 [Kazachstania unispora]